MASLSCGTSLASLGSLRSGVRRGRSSSYDPSGGNADSWLIPAGESRTLAHLSGPGCIRHIWMTTLAGNFNLRGLCLRMHWDGEGTPSVQCPLGDFFGLGHARPGYMQSAPLQAAHLGMNCWFPMPFRKEALVTLTNDSPHDSLIYFYIDYECVEKAADDAAYFHANWRRELVVRRPESEGPNVRGQQERLNTTGGDNYLVLETEGRGHYVGCVLHLDTNEPGWWGEGDDMFFIDGESWPPRLHGTGMEDYFCGAWNYNNLARTYDYPYYGYHMKGNADYTGKHSQYRFHVEDPVYFEKSLRFSIEHGHANDRQGDWSSTAYWYQIGRERELPPLGTFEDRVPYAFGGADSGAGKDRRGLPGG